MAELVGLLASIAGVTTAGLQVAKLLYSSIQHLKGMQDEIQGVAREIQTLSSVFGEISRALQLGGDDIQSTSHLMVSRNAVTTISGLVEDSQNLYAKIEIVLQDNKSLLKLVSTLVPITKVGP